MKRIRFFVASVALLGGLANAFADRFGDLNVVPQAFVSGETHHGYREFRILIENQSDKDEHRITLVFPEHTYNYGNSISRITRTVKIAPVARAVVPLWQPPLPIGGDGLMRVMIDGEYAGSVNLPGNSHMTRTGARYGGGGGISPTVLVSRSVNYDDWARVLKSVRNEYSAGMATGAPDSGRSRGMVPTAWMPESSRPGPHWLELDFAKPVQTDTLDLYETAGLVAGGEILLTGTSGTNVGRIIIGPTSPAAVGTARKFTFPLTSEPVRTVRFNFGSAYAGSISIDAVGLENSGHTETVWAATARASSESTAAAMSPGAIVTQVLRAETPATEWSDAWLSYTPFDGIAVTAADVRAMPPAAQLALWRYAEAGGNLFLMGDAPYPDTWKMGPGKALEGGEYFPAGFGGCFRFQNEQVSTLRSGAVKLLNDAINESARLWQSIPDENSANAAFPVIESVKVPVRGIVFIMLAFVITIGPVNLIVLSRMNRRTWLLWTIPAISVFTSLVVFAYSMVREGVTSDVRLEGLTLLDQQNRRASTQGATAFYCPLTPSQGLFFGSETEATPLVESWDYRSGTQREMDWTQAQHLQRGWVSARVPAHFYLRRSETRRERLQLETSGAETTVMNGLGAPIRALWLADKSGRIFTANKIEPGQKAMLLQSAETPHVEQQRGARALSGAIAFTQLSAFDRTTVPEYLLPGTYVAELDGDPFLENGLGSRAQSARNRVRALVFGILETTPQP